MSAFALKLIACITMFIDHLGYIIYNGNASWLNCIGRLAFPIFAFQISEGYCHTKDVKKYMFRLMLFAIISQFPFALFHSIISDEFSLNVIFTLLFGMLSILVYDKSNKILGVLTAFSLGIIAQLTKCDYGFYGVIIILLFYLTRNNKKLLVTSFSTVTAMRYAYNILKYHKYGMTALKTLFIHNLPFAICTILSVAIIALYNKQKGSNTKYWLYIFYPAHLLLLYIIYII